MQHLTAIQKEGMGAHISGYQSDFYGLFTNVEADDIEDTNELQPISEFEDSGKRKPNLMGTGRNKITKKRKTIYLMKLGRSFKVDFKILSELMNAYFGMEVKILDSKLKIAINDKVVSVIDSEKKLGFPLKNIKNKRIDVFSLFDVLVEYIPNDCYTLITLTDYEIYDPEVPDNFIYGRACGDRVAVIHDLKDQTTTLMTVLHETMHTMGIDHCVAWKCLMNAFIVDTFEICPMDLKKLEIACKFNLIERQEKLIKLFKKLKLKEPLRINQRKLQILKKMK